MSGLQRPPDERASRSYRVSLGDPLSLLQGGVGLMTVAMLLKNTLQSFDRSVAISS